MTIAFDPPVRFRIPAQKFLDVMYSESCRSNTADVWPQETEVTQPDPDEPTPTPSPEFRPLSPLLDTMTQARYHLYQQGFSSAHYVEITDDDRYRVVKRNLLVDKLRPIIDQYGYLAVQSVLLRYRPESVALPPSIPVVQPDTPGPVVVEEEIEEKPDKLKKPKRPKTKADRDRREYHREYRRKQKELLKMAIDTNDLLKDVIEERKTDANPDGTGTPVINDEIQVMVTDADKITGTDTGINIITDPDVKPKVSEDNPYGIEPEIHTGSETVSDTVTPVVNQSTTPSVGEISPTDRQVDEEALRAKGNADETPVTASQPVPDPKGSQDPKVKAEKADEKAATKKSK